MTLQDIGSIGELVGAIATLATLVYLAVQVRQNSKQMADSARLARFGFTDRTVEAFSRYRGLMAQPQNAEIYVRGLESYAELNQADRIIFRALMEEYFFAFTRIFEQMGLGFAYPNWTAQARAAAAILKTPGGAAWWNNRKVIFDKAFVSEMERFAEIESIAEHVAPADAS